MGSLALNLPKRKNIQGWWRLDEAVGNAIDSGPNGNDLIETSGTIASVPGVINNARDFERTETEYFAITDGLQTGLDIIGEITICAWIKIESLGTIGGIVGKWETNGNLCYILYQESTNKLRFALSIDGTNFSIGQSADDLSAGSDLGS